MQFMGELHSLIENHGKHAAIAVTANRPVVEAAVTYMSDPDAGIGYIYSGLCQAALPHRCIPNEETWTIRSDHVTLVVEPGRRPNPISGQSDFVGVPYGSRARLIMLYLQSEALRTGSRNVELGRSMRDWLGRLGVPPGGKSIESIRNQAERISRCNLVFEFPAGTASKGLSQTHIVDDAIFLDGTPSNQGSLFLDTARLSEKFFAKLQAHAVPLEEAAIRPINNNSMALDAYAWLAFRLHSLKGPVPITWSALKVQFGAGFASLRHFKETFSGNLSLATAVYPEAKVDVNDRGLTLMPSPPPVRPKLIAVSHPTAVDYKKYRR
jgi:hypothetical protein